ncbi:hypothetical protein TcWFU_006978 [Taenia crassiceps]|uniref:Uncharacterized protein n=1 Tax=Taenia crassiceps TaxID=6207 RepID=A0ABR4Q1R9_9CEST
MASTSTNSICEESGRSKEGQQQEQQQEQHQQAENAKVIGEQASVHAEGNSRPSAEQSNVSISSEVRSDQNARNEVVGVPGSAVGELHAAASKVLNATTTRLQPDTDLKFDNVDVLIQQIADFSTKIAKLEDVHSSLKGDTEEPAEHTSPEKLPVESQQAPLQSQTDPSSQISNVLANSLEAINYLNRAAGHLRTTRACLLHQQKQAALYSLPIYNDFNMAVAAIETALTKTFNTALSRVDTSALEAQKNFETLTADMANAQSILLTIPDVLPKLDDEKIQFEEILRIFNGMQRVRNTAHVVHQALVDFNSDRYVLASEGLKLMTNALDNFELITGGGSTDYEVKR